jgi:hypothetical protein
LTVPTGGEQHNPAGLMKAMGASLEVQEQLHSFIQRLTHDHELAAQFDDAVMKSDRAAIENLFRARGISSEISIREIDPDRMIVFAFCAGWYSEGMSCTLMTIEW